MVLSTPASREQELNYGADVGTISLSIFRERAPDDIRGPFASLIAQDFAPSSDTHGAALGGPMRERANAGTTSGDEDPRRKDVGRGRVVPRVPRR